MCIMQQNGAYEATPTSLSDDYERFNWWLVKAFQCLHHQHLVTFESTLYILYIDKLKFFLSLAVKNRSVYYCPQKKTKPENF